MERFADTAERDYCCCCIVRWPSAQMSTAPGFEPALVLCPEYAADGCRLHRRPTADGTLSYWHEARCQHRNASRPLAWE